MTTLKRMFAGLVSLIMVFSLFSVMPVMATGEETETETIEFADIFEQIRKETNIVTNGDLEAEIFNYSAAAKQGNYCLRWNNGTQSPTYALSKKESYSGGQSLFAASTGGYDHAVALTPMPKKGTTYIASVMALGTVANLPHWNYNTLKADVTYQPKFALTIEGRAGGAIKDTTPGQIILGDCTYTASGTAYFTTNTLASAVAYDDTEGAKSAASEWKRMYSTIEVIDNIDTLGVGVYMALQNAGLADHPEATYVELYTDDYYIGELMVADVECTTPTTINVSKLGTTEVELKATAYNQIENTVGLTDAEYIWELLTPMEGVKIEDNKLLVADDVKTGDIKVRVTAVPKFFGADGQSEKITKYRSKDITFTVNDYFRTLRNSKNMIPKQKNSDLKDTFTGISGWTDLAAEIYNDCEISTKQAYTGQDSILIKSKNYSHTKIPHIGSGFDREKTYVASAMVLGTQANSTVCEANPNSSVKMQMAKFVTGGMNPLKNDGKEGFSGGNSVLLNTMLEAPATSTNGEVVSKDKWKMVHAYGVYSSSINPLWGIGAGVQVPNNAEVYTDDYYFGELIVAKVKGTTEKAYITSEENTVELTAETYNQLGTTDYFGENTTYAWNAESLPEGVQLVDGKLVIAPTAKEGQAVLTVTVTPDFMGAEAQTAEQKAYRTATVTVDIVDQARFTFAEADGKITATAVAGELDKNAKIYCAIYKVEKEAETEKEILKLMDVEIKDLVPGGENVAFTAIDKPDYEYVIKCFMIDINKLEAVIPAASN